MTAPAAEKAVEERNKLENAELLVSLQGILELPMVLLSFLMLSLFLIEVTTPLPPECRRTFNLIEWFIWVAFIIEYVVKLAIAPDKLRFLKENWLMTLAIVMPVFRIFRVLRAVRVARSIGTLRVVTVGNRAITKLEVLFKRRRLQYLIAAAVIVTILSASGVYYIEREVYGANITTYGDALWWSAGTVTTVGTELYPITAEGRVLAVILMIFGVSIFGYLAGSLASFFVHVDKEDDDENQTAASPNADESLDKLTQQIQALEQRITLLNQITGAQSSAPSSPEKH